MAVKKTKKKIKTKKTKESGSVKAVLSGESIISNSKKAAELYGKSRFGEPSSGKIYYSAPEALYLVETKKMSLTLGKKKLNFEKLLEILKENDKKIATKYPVFKDLRQRGYIVKTALKFGAEFRVYDKGIKPGEDHARWILYPVSENQEMTWYDFAAKNRVAHATKKNLLIGIVDDEGDVTYYEIKWIKP
ncbi:tRNA-intron lyase [Candidatus Woesearchaeota archaeon CG10_big_fil_rev_8_21_14_0_10_34_12]|nr:MAG: tRNA-intron lyase [Candidatus Woesearchaeota archaeon CG10_big_fil_rev_8_21_14_0_10_34_12]